MGGASRLVPSGESSALPSIECRLNPPVTESMNYIEPRQEARVKKLEIEEKSEQLDLNEES